MRVVFDLQMSEESDVVYVYVDETQEGTVDAESLGQVIQIAAAQHKQLGKGPATATTMEGTSYDTKV